MGSNIFFPGIDLTSEILQLALEEEGQKLIALNTLLDRPPKKETPTSWLASAPGTFQNPIEMVFKGLCYKVGLVPLDKTSDFGETFDEDIQCLEPVFAPIEQNSPKNNRSGCKLLQRRMQKWKLAVS